MNYPTILSPSFRMLCLTWIFVLGIIGTQPLDAQDTEKPAVVCTVSMIADMAHEIIGDKATVSSIVPIGGDPHLYEPTPSAAQLVNSADLVLMNGLTFEGWLAKLVDNAGTKAPVVLVTEGIETIQSLEYANSPDPHAWMNAQNAIIYATNITKAAQELMPEHAAEFGQRFEAYKKELEALDQEIKEQVARIPSQQRVVITSHDAFQYYGQAYGLRLEASMGTSTDADVKTADMMNLQKVIQETGVPAIFVESTINPKLIQQLAKDNGIKIGGKLYADSLGPKGSGADTYISMMRKNTETIVNALTQQKAAPPSDTDAETSGSLMDKGMWFIIGAIVGLMAIFLLLRNRNN